MELIYHIYNGVELVNHIEGSKYWYLNGQLHRVDGPAVERPNGSEEWWLNDRRHRENGPAVIEATGTTSWYLDGKLHREDGPAVEYADGSKCWYLDGKFFGCKQPKNWKELVRMSRVELIMEI